MFKVIYRQKFLLRVESDDPLEAKALSDFLGVIGLYWNSDHKAYPLSAGQLNELLQWCVHQNFRIVLSDEAEKEYRKYLDETFRPVTHFRRGKIETADLSAFLKNEYRYNQIQLDGIVFSLTRSNSLNADEQGLGKSLMALTKIWYDLKHEIVDGYLLLVMSGLSWHFVFESLKFSDFLKEDDFLICSNENKRTVFTDAIGKKVIIIPHHLWAEAFFYADRSTSERKKSLKKVRWSSVSTDIKTLWQKKSIGIVVDESQVFKNPEAIKTKALLASSSQFQTKLLTSATPNITAFEDIYTQARFLDPSIIPMEYNAFKVWLSRRIGTSFSYNRITAYHEQRINEVRTALAPFVIKRLKSDIEGFDYVIRDRVKYFHLSMDQLTLYKAIREMETLKVLKEHKGHVTVANITSHFPYSLQVLENPFLLVGKLEDKTLAGIVEKWSLDKDPRITYLDAFIDDYVNDRGKKVVIFDGHPLTLDQLEKRYKKYHPLKIHGQMKEVKDKEFYRKDIERKFNDSSKHKVLLLSTYTSKAGISVNVGSDCIVFFNPPLNPEAFSQAKERIHRVNNTRDSYVHSLLFPNSFQMVQYQRNIRKDKFNSSYLNRPLNEKEIAQLLGGEY